jgi:hypothetical protein
MLFASCNTDTNTPVNTETPNNTNNATQEPTNEPTIEPTVEPTEVDWRTLYPEEDIELLQKFFDIWNDEERDFSEVLIYRDDGHYPDPENLKAGHWAIDKVYTTVFVDGIDFLEIVGEYTDKESSLWGHCTLTYSSQAEGIKLYLDPDLTNVYLVKLDVTVDQEKYDDFLENAEEPNAFMPDTAYTLIVLTTVGDERLVFTLYGGDYIILENIGFDIPDDEMQRWLEREAYIQQDWE